MNKKFIYQLLTLVFLFVSLAVDAQKTSITGTVSDASTNLGMEGVTISLKTGEKSRPLTKTGKDGSFVLKGITDTTIIFSRVGYRDAYQKVGHNEENYQIMLQPADNPMKDVVVVGYQNKVREEFTGAATIINGKDLQDVPAANVLNLLQGRVAGLNIQNNNGTPGMAGTIQLRGISNINVNGAGGNAYLTPTSPLFVIDGVPVDQNEDYQYGFENAGPGISPLSLIPTEDIAEIQVLKDAEATSLYGSKGAYGVILITTRRGQSKVPIVQYSGKYFVSTVPPMHDVIVGKGERELRIQQTLQWDTSYADALDRVNQADFLSDSLNPYYNNNTDWQSLFYRTTMNQSHNVNVSGGTQKFNYKINTGYYNENGVIENTGFSRYSLSMNAGYRPNDKFDFSFNVSSSLGINSKGSGNSLFQTGVASAGMSSSLLPPPSLYIASNDALSAVSVEDENKTASLSSSVNIRYSPAKWVQASSTFSYSYKSGTENTFTPSSLNSGYSKIKAYNSNSVSIYNRNTLSFIKSFNDAHNFSLYFFNEISSGQSKTSNLGQRGTPNDIIQGPFGYDWANQSGDFGYDESKSVGFSGSFAYNYKSKYVVNASYRYDGTSTNGPNAKWTQNPSLGLRWNFYKENWFKNINWLDYASLRGSWGKNIVPTGSIYDIYGKYTINDYTYNNYKTISINLGSIPNLDLTSSVTTSWNGGIEAGFLNGRFSFSLDAYYKQSDKLLRSKNISTINGFETINTNETSLVDYGYELSLGFRPLPKESKLQWSISVNGAINHDYIAHLPDGVRQLALEGGTTQQPTVFRLGSNALSNLLYNYIGIYPSIEEVPVDPNTGLRYRIGGTSVTSASYFQGGDPMWVDINGDYMLDQNDLVIVGDFEPKITGGLSSNFNYGQFGFSFHVSYTFDRDLLNNALADRFKNYKNPLDISNGALVPLSSYGVWQNVGDNAIFPNPFDYTRNGTINPFRYNQTLFLEDGSYIKINSITFSYNLKKEFIKKYGISSMRVYGSASNIHTFSLFNGPNAEMASSVGITTSDLYPTHPDYTFGLDIQF